MKKTRHLYRYFILIVVLILLVFPIAQSRFNLITVPPLNGSFATSPDDTFSINKWLSGSYQNKKEKYLNENFGFRNVLVRLNNQIAYMFFNKAKANGVIIGKDNYLYDRGAIETYYGQDFVGADSIRNIMQRLKFVQDTLAKLDKTLLVVFAPGKGSFYPEYIPEKWKEVKKSTNYEYFIKYSNQLNINHIDFCTWFVKNKNKSKYSLYPKFGMHWSIYGSCLVADSIIRYIGAGRNINMGGVYWDKISIDYPRDNDKDILTGMNLLFNPTQEKMAYPEIQFLPDSGKTKPNVMVVADSYYWTLFNLGISKAFSASHFWYYNQIIYTANPKEHDLTVSQVNLGEEIKKHDVIIILATEANLKKFGWGFVENAYGLFKGQE